MKTVYEPGRELVISKSCDVFICGGGIAGIAAALGAARLGQRVILCEKQCALGGLATLGLVTIYLPLCDGRGNWVMRGLAEELLRLSIRHGYDAARFPYPEAWLTRSSTQDRTGTRFQVQYNPFLFAFLCEELLQQEGVELLLDTRVEGVVMAGKSIAHAVISNKGGRSAVSACAFIDASGDADLCQLSGERTVVNPKNALAAWNYTAGREGLRCNVVSKPYDPIAMPATDTSYDGTKGEDVTALLLDGHRNTLAFVLEQRTRKKDPELMPVTVPMVPPFRMTRRLEGAYTLDELEERKPFFDAIGMITDWRKAGPIFNVPHRALYGENVSNLIVAGRIISVTQPMWEISRSIPCCAVTGEAAGVAAAVKNRSGAASFALTDVSAIQVILKEHGVLINCDFDVT